MLDGPTGNTSPVGLLERWDARNQEILERQNHVSNEWWAQATEQRPPRWLRIIGWYFFLGGCASVVIGIATRDVARVALGAVSVMVWGLDLVVWRFVRRNRR